MSLVGHWEEAKFPAGINLVQTMAPGWRQIVSEVALDLITIPAVSALPTVGGIRLGYIHPSSCQSMLELLESVKVLPLGQDQPSIPLYPAVATVVTWVCGLLQPQEVKLLECPGSPDA